MRPTLRVTININHIAKPLKDQLSKIKGVKEKKQNGVLKKYARQQGMTKDHARGFNWKFKVSVDDKDRYFLRRQT